MNNSKSQVKVQPIDNNASKNKILYAGATLLVGLLVAIAFSSGARAETPVDKEAEVKSATFQIYDKAVMPFQVKSQKLSH